MLGGGFILSDQETKARTPGRGSVLFRLERLFFPASYLGKYSERQVRGYSLLSRFTTFSNGWSLLVEALCRASPSPIALAIWPMALFAYARRCSVRHHREQRFTIRDLCRLIPSY